jgi:hypothetical protein
LKLTARERSIATCLVLLVLGLIFFTCIVQPRLKRLQAVNEKFVTEKKLLDMKRVEASRQSIEVEKHKQLVGELGRQRDCLFAGDQATAFVAGLSKVAEESRCRFIKVDFLGEEKLFDRLSGKAKETAREGLSKVSLRLYLKGYYPGLIDLLRALESQGDSVHVGQLNLSVVDPAGSELDVSLVLTIYSQEMNEEENA